MRKIEEFAGTGVYLILNKVNSKVYVGSAARQLLQRWNEHQSHLRRKVHCNKHLQAAWDKYGETNFEFSVLERCRPEECIKSEQKWIDKLEAANPLHGYNQAPLAGSNLGMEVCAKTRRMHVLRRRGMGSSIRQYKQRVGMLKKLGRVGTEAARTPEARKKNSLAKTGEKHGQAKLTNQQVAEIRAKRIAGAMTITLAAEYGVAACTISSICNGHSRKRG